MHSAKGVAWLRVRVVFAGSFQDRVNVIEGSLKMKLVWASSIASLNTTTMSASSATPVAPSAGLVDTMNGFGQRAVNDHGFGTGPATSVRPARSSPSVMFIVYSVHAT